MNEEQMKLIAELYAKNDKLEIENNELQNKIHTLEEELNWYKQKSDVLEIRICLDD